MADPDNDLKERMQKLLLDKKTHDVSFAIGPVRFERLSVSSSCPT